MMIMGDRAKALAERFAAFNNEVIAFVGRCSDDDWQKVCPGEGWTIGVAARHIAAGHYNALGLAKMIVAGEKLPDITMEAINQGNAKHAKDHADCTKDEVFGILRDNGSSISGYVNALTDEDLDRTGHLGLAGGAISTQQFIENIIIQSAREHLSSMKAVLGA